MNEHQELMKDFLLESYENLDRLDRDLVALEKKPDDTESISSIFRTIHTIKGTCGFLGLHKLESVTHVGENLLSRLRDGALKLNAERTSGMLAMFDAVREILGTIERTDAEGDTDYTALVSVLTKLKDGQEGVIPAGGMAALVAKATVPSAAASTPSDISGPEVENATIDAALTALVPPVATVDVAALLGEVSAAPAVTFAKPQAQVVDGIVLDGRSKVTEDHHVVSIAQAAAHVAPASTPTGGVDSDTGKSAIADSTIRVDVHILDRLMNLVGELVLARNQILQYTSAVESVALTSTTQRLNLITSELQEGVMKTRMQPINVIWQKLPRVVRDLGGQCGKQVELELEGKETELDKTIIEAIKDPLTHIVRNSIDHGIESPDARAAKGKSRVGKLTLRAFHEGGQVNIDIRDDGAGINVDRVKGKAVEKGLITAEQAARMGEREALNLIFLPGFSTAEKITNVSGRGVGMDVVKTNIARIGGTVDIQSRPGDGTTLRIKIPLTLAIIPALLVGAGSERFAIPQVSLLELVRVEAEQIKTSIEYIHGAPVYRLRGNLLPLVYLRPQLGLGTSDANANLHIVVLHADGRHFGLIVDDIYDAEEIVVKPLGKQLKGTSAFAGATIMGDGRVALILDVMGIATASGVLGDATERAESNAARDALAESAATTTVKQSLLLVTVGKNRRMAVPLEKVTRLEEFDASIIEHEGDLEVVQYRGSIMPLVRLSQRFAQGTLADTGSEAAQDTIHVVVHGTGRSVVGLVVEAILDVAEESDLNIDHRKAHDGLLGTAVIGGRVTELVDITALAHDLRSDSPPTLLSRSEVAAVAA